MKVFALALAGAFLAIAGSSAASTADALVLDLTNWGEGIYYLKGRVLSTESNGKAGLQDAPEVGKLADALVLP